MTAPKFESKVSLGNLLTLIAMGVAGLLAFATVQGDVAANTSAVGDIEGRVRVLEKDSTKQAEQFRALAQGLGDIKDQQRENNRLLRELLSRD